MIVKNWKSSTKKLNAPLRLERPITRRWLRSKTQTTRTFPFIGKRGGNQLEALSWLFEKILWATRILRLALVTVVRKIVNVRQRHLINTRKDRTTTLVAKMRPVDVFIPIKIIRTHRVTSNRRQTTSPQDDRRYMNTTRVTVIMLATEKETFRPAINPPLMTQVRTILVVRENTYKYLSPATCRPRRQRLEKLPISF